MRLDPGDLLFTFRTDRHTVQIEGILTSRTEGRVYRYIMSLVDEDGNAKGFTMDYSVAPDLRDHAGLTPKEADSIQRHLDEIAELVRRWDPES